MRDRKKKRGKDTKRESKKKKDKEIKQERERRREIKRQRKRNEEIKRAQMKCSPSPFYGRYKRCGQEQSRSCI